jgi:uncharacterized protein YjiS (DUF1127 family)
MRKMTSVERADSLRIVSVQSEAPVQTGRSMLRRVAGVLDAIDVWVGRFKQRRELSEMSDHVLHDIGISRSDAERESRKPFWR